MSVRVSRNTRGPVSPPLLTLYLKRFPVILPLMQASGYDPESPSSVAGRTLLSTHI